MKETLQVFPWDVPKIGWACEAPHQEKCSSATAQFMITDMILGTESAEAFLRSCAARADSSPDTAVINGLKAKLFASEAATDVSDKAIQVLGGHGYCRDFVVERLFRDARGLTLHFKTSELLRKILLRQHWDCDEII